MEELKRLRKARGLSQAKLAALADLDPSTVSQIETGARRANTRTLERLAVALGADVADLFPKAQAPLPLEESERGVTPSSPLTAERALTLADSGAFRQEAKAASVEELQQASLELARFTKPQTRKNPSTREETHRRVIAHERIGIIEGELEERGAPSPVTLVIKQLNDATSHKEETQQRSHEAQEGKETA